MAQLKELIVGKMDIRQVCDCLASRENPVQVRTLTKQQCAFLQVTGVKHAGVNWEIEGLLVTEWFDDPNPLETLALSEVADNHWLLVLNQPSVVILYYRDGSYGKLSYKE